MQWVVVFDTNILLSSLFSLRSNPFRCLALAKIGAIQSVTCEEILDEFQKKLQDKFAYSPQRVRAAVDEVRSVSRLVPITNTLKVVSDDPDDDKILECALIGGATHLVTGDRRHLIPLNSYRGISIVSATQLIALVSA